MQRGAVVDLPLDTFDLPTRKLMGRVCDEVWDEVLSRRLFSSAADAAEIRYQITRRIVSAVTAGERDFERLKAWALWGFVPAAMK